MKYTRPNGSCVEGTPEEIAQYHKLITGRRDVTVPKGSAVKLTHLKQEDLFDSKPRTKSRRTVDFHRAAWSRTERARALEMFHEHKLYKNIARTLWKEKLSPFARTFGAVRTEITRMLNDPTRR